jgi:hypothetical protein
MLVTGKDIKNFFQGTDGIVSHLLMAHYGSLFYYEHYFRDLESMNRCTAPPANSREFSSQTRSLPWLNHVD